jgi:hypothetical protein
MVDGKDVTGQLNHARHSVPRYWACVGCAGRSHHGYCGVARRRESLSHRTGLGGAQTRYFSPWQVGPSMKAVDGRSSWLTTGRGIAKDATRGCTMERGLGYDSNFSPLMVWGC